ncbi:MAG: phosphoserine phosphatase SerB, partial [Proteobacteria bacterium]|nr:phosphoserine phosphatase SerB [Pseudomonadota bacterium]
LARRITADHIAHITGIGAKYGLNIDNISRLSGRISLGSSAKQTKSCVEFSLRGKPTSPKAMKGEFLQAANSLGVDIAFYEENMFRRNRRLVVFDMDSTLIEAEVIDELAKAAGVGKEVAEITEKAMNGRVKFKDSFKQRVALLKGLDEKFLEQIARNLPLAEGAENLLTTLRKLGYKTAILSGGFNYFGRYLQKKLGIDYVYANQMEIVDGQITGKVVGKVIDGDRKKSLLKEIADREGISLEQVIAVGDGANDLPMLNVAGLGIAFRAKRLVKENTEHSISALGLDGILYLIGFRDRDQLDKNGKMLPDFK